MAVFAETVINLNFLQRCFMCGELIDAAGALCLQRRSARIFGARGYALQCVHEAIFALCPLSVAL
jgi:hypothetical protein